MEGAKSYQANTPNAEVYLKDIEDPDTIYIKTTDALGRPEKLIKRSLGKEEIINMSKDAMIDTSDFVTTKELNDILDEKFERFFETFNNQRSGNRTNGSRRNKQNNRHQEDIGDETD